MHKAFDSLFARIVIWLCNLLLNMWDWLDIELTWWLVVLRKKLRRRR